MDQPLVPDEPAPRFTSVTLAQQVYDHLRQRILANDYPPGTSLPEEALAAKFSVSRVPVREALRRLAADGLVTLTPRQGATVSSLSPKQFLDAYRVREALETLAIRLALPKLDAADRAELESLHEQMRAAALAGDEDRFFALNGRFHARFVERADNAELKAIYEPLIDKMRRYRSPSAGLRGGLDRSVEEHEAILSAIRAGDAEEAARLLSEHIRVPQTELQASSFKLQAAGASPAGEAGINETVGRRSAGSLRLGAP